MLEHWSHDSVFDQARHGFLLLYFNCCLQGQLCGLCLWFWPKRKMRMILWIKITLQKWRYKSDAAKLTLQKWRCKKERALATLLADGITSTNNPLIVLCHSISRWHHDHALLQNTAFLSQCGPGFSLLCWKNCVSLWEFFY